MADNHIALQKHTLDYPYWSIFWYNFSMPHHPASKNYSFFLVGERYITESKALFATNTIRTFSESLVGLYIPIFIFLESSGKFNFDDNFIVNGFITIFLFYAAKTLASMILTQNLVNLIAGSLKFKGSILVGNILLGLGFLVVSMSQYDKLYLFISAIIFGAGSVLYWIPYHTYFIRSASSADGKYGKKIGLRQVLSRLASISGPFLGATIINFYGFNTLFLVAFSILLVSGLPLYLSDEEHEHGKHNAMTVFLKYINNRKYIYNTVAFGAMGIDGILFSILSPILVWQFTNSIALLGTITTISIGISSIIAIKVGKSVDKNGPENLQKIGISINTLLYILRAFASVPIVVYIADLVDRVNNNFFTIPFISSMYTYAKRGNHETDFVIYRSYVTDIAILAGIFISTIFVKITGEWQQLFLLLAVISPLTYLIQVEKIPAKS